MSLKALEVLDICPFLDEEGGKQKPRCRANSLDVLEAAPTLEDSRVGPHCKDSEKIKNCSLFILRAVAHLVQLSLIDPNSVIKLWSIGTERERTLKEKIDMKMLNDIEEKADVQYVRMLRFVRYGALNIGKGSDVQREFIEQTEDIKNIHVLNVFSGMYMTMHGDVICEVENGGKEANYPSMMHMKDSMGPRSFWFIVAYLYKKGLITFDEVVGKFLPKIYHESLRKQQLDLKTVAKPVKSIIPKDPIEFESLESVRRDMDFGSITLTRHILPTFPQYKSNGIMPHLALMKLLYDSMVIKNVLSKDIKVKQPFTDNTGMSLNSFFLIQEFLRREGVITSEMIAKKMILDQLDGDESD